jgi:hypothetical protein
VRWYFSEQTRVSLRHRRMVNVGWSIAAQFSEKEVVRGQ